MYILNKIMLHTPWPYGLQWRVKDIQAFNDFNETFTLTISQNVDKLKAIIDQISAKLETIPSSSAAICKFDVN